MTAKTVTRKEIWETLSRIDCSEHVEKKANLAYLSWTWAWSTLMGHYPESTFSFLENETGTDGTVTVRCIVDVHGHTREMWLPVMDNRNNAIVNPDARKISDAKMRCLVKCIAMHGLGLYIYAGEDLPQESAEAKNKAAAEANAMFEKAIAAMESAESIEALQQHYTAAKTLCSSKEEVARVVEIKDKRKAELK